MEGCEKQTDLFANLEKIGYQKKTVKLLRNKDGK